jgi:D-alanyl-D-alanine carboxypeptidase
MVKRIGKKVTKSSIWLKIFLGLFGVGLAVIIFISVGGLINNVEAPAPQDEEQTIQVDQSINEAEPEQARLDIKTVSSQFVLVNKQNPLASIDYRPSDLVVPNVKTVGSDSKDEQSIRELIRPDLEEMMNDAAIEGHSLMMNSGFRTSQKQAFYYNNYVKNSGEAAANKFSAKPGYSEHQTGLSMDISYLNRKCYLEECFGESAAGIWLAKHSHEYGFILRYPKGKESITGYQYEPWHFRFVGKETASEIYKNQMTYEEYLISKDLITS